MAERVKIQMEVETSQILAGLDQIQLKMGDTTRKMRASSRESKKDAESFIESLNNQEVALSRISEMGLKLAASFGIGFSVDKVVQFGRKLDEVYEKVKKLNEERQLSEAQVFGLTGDMPNAAFIQQEFSKMNTGLAPQDIFQEVRNRLPEVKLEDTLELTKDIAENAWRASGGQSAAQLAGVSKTASAAYRAGFATDTATDVAFKIQQDAGAGGEQALIATERLAGLYLGGDLTDKQKREGFADISALSVIAAGQMRLEGSSVTRIFRSVQDAMKDGVGSDGQALKGLLSEFDGDVSAATMHAVFNLDEDTQRKIFGKESLPTVVALKNARGRVFAEREAIIGTDSQYMNEYAEYLPQNVRDQLEAQAQKRVGEVETQGQPRFDEATNVSTRLAQLKRERADRSPIIQTALNTVTWLKQAFLPQGFENDVLGGDIVQERDRRIKEDDIAAFNKEYPPERLERLEQIQRAKGLPLDTNALFYTFMNDRRTGRNQPPLDSNIDYRVEEPRTAVRAGSPSAPAPAAQNQTVTIQVYGPEGADVIATSAAGSTN